jgi:hypothetical protein
MLQLLHSTSLWINDGQPISLDLTIPSPTVAILDIKVGRNQPPVPFHWRAGDWSRPPLDISLSDAGSVESVQVVCNKGELRRVEFAMPRVSFGTPIFDVSGWPESRYRDCRLAVAMARTGSEEITVDFGIAGRTARALNVGPGLNLILSEAQDLVGFSVTGIKSKDLDWLSEGPWPSAD